jgi:hypothetical protein
MWVNLDKEMFIDGVLLVCIAICALSIALSFVPFQIHHDSTITLSYPQPSVSIQPVETTKKEIVAEESAIFTAV